MSDFVYTEAKGIPKKYVCEECVATAIKHVPTGLTSVYCSHNRCGAFRLGKQHWRILYPCTADHVRGVMLHAILEGEHLIMELSANQARN